MDKYLCLDAVVYARMCDRAASWIAITQRKIKFLYISLDLNGVLYVHSQSVCREFMRKIISARDNPLQNVCFWLSSRVCRSVQSPSIDEYRLYRFQNSQTYLHRWAKPFREKMEQNVYFRRLFIEKNETKELHKSNISVGIYCVRWKEWEWIHISPLDRHAAQQQIDRRARIHHYFT